MLCLRRMAAVNPTENHQLCCPRIIMINTGFLEVLCIALQRNKYDLLPSVNYLDNTRLSGMNNKSKGKSRLRNNTIVLGTIEAVWFVLAPRRDDRR